MAPHPSAFGRMLDNAMYEAADSPQFQLASDSQSAPHSPWDERLDPNLSRFNPYAGVPSYYPPEAFPPGPHNYSPYPYGHPYRHGYSDVPPHNPNVAVPVSPYQLGYPMPSPEPLPNSPPYPYSSPHGQPYDHHRATLYNEPVWHPHAEPYPYFPPHRRPAVHNTRRTYVYNERKPQNCTTNSNRARRLNSPWRASHQDQRPDPEHPKIERWVKSTQAEKSCPVVATEKASPVGDNRPDKEDTTPRKQANFWRRTTRHIVRDRKRSQGQEKAKEDVSKQTEESPLPQIVQVGSSVEQKSTNSAPEASTKRCDTVSSPTIELAKSPALDASGLSTPLSVEKAATTPEQKLSSTNSGSTEARAPQKAKLADCVTVSPPVAGPETSHCVPVFEESTVLTGVSSVGNLGQPFFVDGSSVASELDNIEASHISGLYRDYQPAHTGPATTVSPYPASGPGYMNVLELAVPISRQRAPEPEAATVDSALTRLPIPGHLIYNGNEMASPSGVWTSVQTPRKGLRRSKSSPDFLELDRVNASTRMSKIIVVRWGTTAYHEELKELAKEQGYLDLARTPRRVPAGLPADLSQKNLTKYMIHNALNNMEIGHVGTRVGHPERVREDTEAEEVRVAIMLHDRAKKHKKKLDAIETEFNIGFDFGIYLEPLFAAKRPADLIIVTKENISEITSTGTKIAGSDQDENVNASSEKTPEETPKHALVAPGPDIGKISAVIAKSNEDVLGRADDKVKTISGIDPAAKAKERTKATEKVNPSADTPKAGSSK